MPEDQSLQTQDQFLIEQKIVPNPEKIDNPEKLKNTTIKLAKSAAILALTLQHTSVITKNIDDQSKLKEQITFQGLRIYAQMYDMPLSPQNLLTTFYMETASH